MLPVVLLSLHAANIQDVQHSGKNRQGVQHFTLLSWADNAAAVHIFSKKKLKVYLNVMSTVQDATMRDLLLNVRADEACHSHVNHTFSELQQCDDNPFIKGNHQIA